jgi:hypothetical protein
VCKRLLNADDERVILKQLVLRWLLLCNPSPKGAIRICVQRLRNLNAIATLQECPKPLVNATLRRVDIDEQRLFFNGTQSNVTDKVDQPINLRLFPRRNKSAGAMLAIDY